MFQALAFEVASRILQMLLPPPDVAGLMASTILWDEGEAKSGLGLYQFLSPGQGFPFTQPACHPGALLRGLLRWQVSWVTFVPALQIFISSPSQLLASSHPSISMNPFSSPSSMLA